MAMDYQNALAGLASGMAGGMPGQGGEDAGGGSEMYPCPLCGGTGMVSEAMLEGGGMPAIPPRLVARGGGQMMGGGAPMGGGMPMSPAMGMGS